MSKGKQSSLTSLQRMGLIALMWLIPPLVLSLFITWPDWLISTLGAVFTLLVLEVIPFLQRPAWYNLQLVSKAMQVGLVSLKTRFLLALGWLIVQITIITGDKIVEGGHVLEPIVIGLTFGVCGVALDSIWVKKRQGGFLEFLLFIVLVYLCGIPEFELKKRVCSSDRVSIKRLPMSEER